MRTPTRPTMILGTALAAAWLLTGCGKETPREPASTLTLGEEASGDGDGECQPGTEACECIDGGLCVDGLLCLSNTCVAFPGGEEDSGEDGGPKPDLGGDGDGDGDGSCTGSCGGVSTTGSCFCDSACEAAGDCCADYESECSNGGCLYNSDCADTMVCSQSGVCVDALWHTYDVYVTWDDGTDKCFDNEFEGSCLADVYMDAYYGGELAYSSPYSPNVISAQFDFTQAMDPYSGLTLSFFDWDDLSPNDPINAVCIGTDECTAIPASTLHNGSVAWEVMLDGASGYVSVGAYFSPH